MHTTTKVPTWKFWLAWLVLVLYFALFSLVLLREWYVVGYVADPAILATYPFGSEGPAAGARNYANAEIYARTAALNGLASTTLLLMALVAGWCRSRRLLGTCLVFAASVVVWGIASAA
jgi:hypothetical protein